MVGRDISLIWDSRTLDQKPGIDTMIRAEKAFVYYTHRIDKIDLNRVYRFIDRWEHYYSSKHLPYKLLRQQIV